MIESTTIDGGGGGGGDNGGSSGSGNDSTTTIGGNNANNSNNSTNTSNNASNVVDNNSNNNSVIDPLETAKWTKYLPEFMGIRESVRSSSYRWCVRESGMWGIATATTMSLHRLRMGSKPLMAGHAFFGTFMIVMLPSYYFCYRRREHQENVIEMMMKYNQFGHAQELPEEPPIEQHPFWGTKEKKQEGTESKDNNTSLQQQFDDTTKHDREFRGLIKERKEWQTQIKEPSFDEIFQETTPTIPKKKKENGK